MTENCCNLIVFSCHSYVFIYMWKEQEEKGCFRMAVGTVPGALFAHILFIFQVRNFSLRATVHSPLGCL